MSAGLNKAIIIGHIGQHPEVRATQKGMVVVNLSVATNESWKDKHTGEKIERTEWHRVAAFGRIAEVVRDYAKKGNLIYIEGRIQTRKWQDKQGIDRYSTEIVASDLKLLGGSRQDKDVQASHKPDPVSTGTVGGDDFDDDIPF